jgi:hypothetical protein
MIYGTGPWVCGSILGLIILFIMFLMEMTSDLGRVMKFPFSKASKIDKLEKKRDKLEEIVKYWGKKAYAYHLDRNFKDEDQREEYKHYYEYYSSKENSAKRELEEIKDQIEREKLGIDE